VFKKIVHKDVLYLTTVVLACIFISSGLSTQTVPVAIAILHVLIDINVIFSQPTLMFSF
jgi:hypothetical protein